MRKVQLNIDDRRIQNPEFCERKNRKSETVKFRIEPIKSNNTISFDKKIRQWLTWSTSSCCRCLSMFFRSSLICAKASAILAKM